MPHLARINLYPIKSLGPRRVAEAGVRSGGALEHDREFALFDAEGKVINGKRTALVHGLRADYDPAQETLCLEARAIGQVHLFHLPDDLAAIQEWLGNFFGQIVIFQRNIICGFPDDKNALGPTLISTSTLEEVAAWFPGLSVDSVRLRFRANLEIGGVPPFWEDHLFGETDSFVPFRIGDITFHGIKPCQRCVVPPRDPQTGEVWARFSETFRARREATLPPWANRTHFNHFYRLAVNTRVSETEAGKRLRVGDAVDLV